MFCLVLKFINESLKIKKTVIETDEFDKSERNKFNYGHTFGHAIETSSNYVIKHGQAVTVGMDIANYISYYLGLIDLDEYNRMKHNIEFNFPDYKWSNFDVKNLLSVFSTIIKTNNSNKLKIGNLNIKKLKKYVLGVLINSK